MKKLLLIFLSIIIISCDEDNLVRDDRVNEKREGWVKVGEFDFGEFDNLERIIAYDENHLLVVADFDGIEHNNPKIYESFDGGLNWNVKIDLSQDYVVFNSSLHYYSMIAFNKNLIAFSDDNKIIYSTDKGNTFEDVDLIKNENNLIDEYILNIDFDINNNVYLLTNYGIKSLDLNNKKIEIIDTTFNREYVKNGKSKYINTINYIDIIDESNAYYVDVENNLLYRTRDKFKSFDSIFYNNDYLMRSLSNFNNTDKIIFNDQVIYQLNSNGLNKSNDAGRSFMNIYNSNIEEYLSKIKSINENIIYLLKYDEDYNFELVVSTNGGMSFEKQIFSDNSNILDFAFLNSKIGFAVGKNGEIYKTTSGGFKD